MLNFILVTEKGERQACANVLSAHQWLSPLLARSPKCCSFGAWRLQQSTAATMSAPRTMRSCWMPSRCNAQSLLFAHIWGVLLASMA